MQFPQLYLIDPKPALCDRLGDCADRDLAEVLVEPVLIRNLEPDKLMWRREEHAVAVKLMFLSYVRELDPFARPCEFESLFGSSRLSTNLFDRWWTIRRLDYIDYDSEELCASLMTFLPIVDTTGNELVDNWIAQLRGKP